MLKHMVQSFYTKGKIMRINKLLAFALIAAMIAVLVPEVQSNAAPRASDPYIRQITSGGTTFFQSGTTGSGELQSPEFPASMEGDADTGSNGPANAPAPIVNRSNSQGQPG